MRNPGQSAVHPRMCMLSNDVRPRRIRARASSVLLVGDLRSRIETMLLHVPTSGLYDVRAPESRAGVSSTLIQLQLYAKQGSPAHWP
eukprot:4872070-Prymnesium_polylepis.1